MGQAQRLGRGRRHEGRAVVDGHDGVEASSAVELDDRPAAGLDVLEVHRHHPAVRGCGDR